MMKRGVKSGGEELPAPTFEGRRQRVKTRQSTVHSPWEVGDDNSDITDASQTPTKTVSSWGVLPVRGFASDDVKKNGNLDRHKRSRAVEELALSGNALTNDIKKDFESKWESFSMPLQQLTMMLVTAREWTTWCLVCSECCRIMSDGEL